MRRFILVGAIVSALGMMAGRSDEAKGAAIVALDHLAYRVTRRAGCPAGHIIRLGAHIGVGFNITTPFQCVVPNLLDVLCLVDKGELLGGS